MLRSPNELGLLLQKICQRLGDQAKVTHKAVIIPGEAQKKSEFLDRCRLRPISNGGELCRVGADTLRIDNMAKIRNVCLRKGTLGQFQFPLIMRQQLKHNTQMGQVLFLGPTIDQYIIKKDEHKLVQTWS